MKSYTVDWCPSAENDLTAIWLGTSDPAVTIAQDQIDDLIGTQPYRLWSSFGRRTLSNRGRASDGFLLYRPGEKNR